MNLIGEDLSVQPMVNIGRTSLPHPTTPRTEIQVMMLEAVSSSRTKVQLESLTPTADE